ncbi:MAG TPA: flagellar filament capping protein FliD [Cellulomonas sp.]
MSATTAIDGLVSGLDTTSLISSLMAVEAAPQTLLIEKQTAQTTLISALQSFNTKVASLATAATTAAAKSSWAATTATSTASSVTATTTSTAQASTLSFTVDKVAQSQSTLYTLPTSYDTDQPTFTLTQGGQTTTITANSSSLANILEAFNADGTGVKATAVNVGTSAAPEYLLQVTSTSTGTDNAFTLSYATGSDGSGSTDLTGEKVRAASDAAITLFPGTSAARTVTSSSNSFSSVLTGVDIVVSAVESSAVTLSVVGDSAAKSTLASNLVSNLNLVLSEITSQTSSTTSTADDGGTIISGGLFSGNSTIRTLQQQLLSLGSTPVNGIDPSTVGITLNKDGTFTFDEDTFAAALAEDPDKVQTVITGLSSRLAELADSNSDSIDGAITLQIKTEQAISTDLGEQIDSWDDRLAKRQETLERIYAALEVSLSTLQSTSSWLTSQIESLTTSSS